MVSSVQPQPPLSILLIEDSKSDALLIEKELNMAIQQGYHLQKAVTLEEALKLLPKHHFNVVLLDRSLPDTEEFDGLYSLQNMAPNLPVVFLTSYQDEKTALESIEQGAQDYLIKGKSNGSIIKRAIDFAILRKKFECSLIERANFDLLTGLPNRWLFKDRLDMAIAKMKRHNTNFAVLFIDLDRFKSINDSSGHAAGDRVLKEVAVRIKQALRPYDTPARFGGDEFAILLECIMEIQDAEKIARKIIDLFDKPIHVFGTELTIALSIGIAMAACSNGQNILSEKLIQQADAAMYKAKNEPGSSYSIFDPAHS